MGGVIDKPITRPVGTNKAAALDSRYTGQSELRGFDGELLLLVGHQVSETHWESEIRHAVLNIYKLRGILQQVIQSLVLNNTQTEKS